MHSAVVGLVLVATQPFFCFCFVDRIICVTEYSLSLIDFFFLIFNPHSYSHVHYYIIPLRFLKDKDVVFYVFLIKFNYVKTTCIHNVNI